MSEIEQIRERFRSGNNVPVPDIRLSRKEWGAIESALAQARREERERVRDMAHKALTKYRHHRAMGATGAAIDTLEDCVTLLSRIRALGERTEK